ncbi:hypothetical protein IW136_004198 [Coemansia sp. RSA 678]|nr:hypothetical protein IW136_004198 [Coemansia sp. RSA 678]
MASVSFWFEFGSPYSMISALRLLRALTGRTNPSPDTHGLPSCQLPDLRDVSIVYRPILLPALFAASGQKTLPGAQVPAKGKYMFHDVRRTLSLLGCPGFPDRPHSNWPPNTVLAGRMAWMLAQGPSYVCALDTSGEPSTKLEQGALQVLAEFVWRVFEAEFIGGEDIGSPKVLERLWNVYVARAELGCEMPSGERAVELASTSAVKDGYKGSTRAAIAGKLFGAPSFTTDDGDMYWGNDHLLEAVAHHKVRSLLDQPLGYCTKSAPSPHI